MNQAKITRLLGTIAAGGGDVAWTIPGDTTTEIKTVGGFYLLLCNIAIDLDELDADLFTAEWSLADLTPQLYEYHTQEHIHAYTPPASSSIDLGAGPRLVYQTPLQWWSSGLLAEDVLSLTLSHAADVELFAIRCATTRHFDSMGVKLR